MEKIPIISVHMSVYNQKRYIAVAVESILAQTYRDFEFVIIDDGSSDGSTEILERFAAQDPRIRLVSRPNTGIGPARNEALGLSRGEFVAVMDSDDIALPHRFQRQVDFLREHPEIVAAGSWVEWIDPEGNPLCDYHPPETHDEIDRRHLEERAHLICHPASMIRTESLRKIGGYRPELAHDFDLWLRLAEVGRLANMPEVLLKYRLHPKSFARTNQSQFWHNEDRAIRDACVRRGRPVSNPPPPPEEAVATEADHRITWAWYALYGGKVVSARRNALRSVWLRPLSSKGWKTLACAIRGY